MVSDAEFLELRAGLHALRGVLEKAAAIREVKIREPEVGMGYEETLRSLAVIRRCLERWAKVGYPPCLPRPGGAPA